MKKKMDKVIIYSEMEFNFFFVVIRNIFSKIIKFCYWYWKFYLLWYLLCLLSLRSRIKGFFVIGDNLVEFYIIF